MGIIAVEKKCGNCEYFSEKLGCAEIQEFLSTVVQGWFRIRTASDSCCKFFDASDEAIEEAEKEDKHQAELRREAGSSYPASLNEGNY